MAKSLREFDRWIAHEQLTWAFRVYRKYNSELYKLVDAQRMASFFTYRQLKATGAHLSDTTASAFAGYPLGLTHFETVKDWSDAYNAFANWVNLSNVLTIAANLETYIAAVVSLAIESDPSVLIGAPARSIDGAYVLKHQNTRRTFVADHVTACTKGEWSSRLAAFERLFGQAPTNMRNKHSALEEIRTIRNRFGHAFGRDIDASRLHGQLDIRPMEVVSQKTVTRLASAAWRFVEAADEFLLRRHIGDYEAVNYYANMYPSQLKYVPPGQRPANLKKAIGQSGAGLRGKVYCNGLVDYWESL